MWEPPFYLEQSLDSKDLFDIRLYNSIVQWLIAISENVDGTQVESSALISPSKITRNGRLIVYSGNMSTDTDITSGVVPTHPDRRFIVTQGKIFSFLGFAPNGVQLRLHKVGGTGAVTLSTVTSGAQNRFFEHINPSHEVDLTASYYSVEILNPADFRWASWSFLALQEL
jgi:hypothetical protein